MATLISSLETQIRRPLEEITASDWTSVELIDLLNKGIKDLWGAIIDLHQKHFLIDDISNVSLPSGATQLVGVPANTFRIQMIEPRNTTSTSTSRYVIFVPRAINSSEFIGARSMDTQNPTSPITIYYDLLGAGSPVSAPVVETAPKISSALTLRFMYVPVLPDMPSAAGSFNPIPGESDNALIAWTIAYARSKERDDRSPDPNWLAIYATEKQNILTRLTPRQEQEPEIVPALFEAAW